jgi:hypothetical protein
MGTAHLHRGGAKTVLGKHTTDGRAFVQQEQTHILAVRFADARFDHANAHTGHSE